MTEIHESQTADWVMFDPFSTYSKPDMKLFLARNGQPSDDIYPCGESASDVNALWNIGHQAFALLNVDTLQDFCLVTSYYFEWVDQIRALSEEHLHQVIVQDGDGQNIRLSEATTSDRGAVSVYKALIRLASPDLSSIPDLDFHSVCFAVGVLRELDDALFKLKWGMAGGLMSAVVAAETLAMADSFKARQAEEPTPASAAPNFSKLANIRWAADPSRKDWELIKSCFDAWQKSKANYSSVPEFARDMLTKTDKLKSQTVIERQARKWKKEMDTPST